PDIVTKLEGGYGRVVDAELALQTAQHQVFGPEPLEPGGEVGVLECARCMLSQNRVSRQWREFIVELPVRRSFLEWMVGFGAVLDKHDRRIGCTSRVDKGSRAVHKFSRPVDGRT